MARPGRLELPTYCLEGSRSIQAELWAHLGSQLTVHSSQEPGANGSSRFLICQPSTMNCKLKVARPGRLELPTYGFEVRRSIQLSYGRIRTGYRG